MTFIKDIDLWILHAINSYSGRSYLLDQIVFFFSENNLVKTIPFVTCLWVLWHDPAAPRERREILTGLIAAVPLALAVTRGLETILPHRARPYVTPDIGFRPPIIGYAAEDRLTDWSSFPSDHATYFFALTTGFWFVSKKLGFVFGLLSLWIVWQRVYLGLHYPTDIAVGALIGIVAAAIMNRRAIRTTLAIPVLGVERRWPMFFNAVFFVVLFEMGGLFNEVRQVLKGLFIVARHYGFI